MEDIEWTRDDCALSESVNENTEKKNYSLSMFKSLTWRTWKVYCPCTFTFSRETVWCIIIVLLRLTKAYSSQYFLRYHTKLIVIRSNLSTFDWAFNIFVYLYRNFPIPNFAFEIVTMTFPSRIWREHLLESCHFNKAADKFIQFQYLQAKGLKLLYDS